MSTPLVLAWSDDLFLQGHQFARWVTDYVDLEESLTMGALAQDLLAHAAAVMGTCGVGAEGRDWRVYERPAEEWFPSRAALLPDRDWPATVARGFLLNRASLVMRDHADLSGRPRDRDVAEIIWAEQDLHSHHWERWVKILATNADVAGRFEYRLQEAALDAADLFGLPTGREQTDEIFSGATPAEMHRQWVKETTQVLDRVGVTAPELPSTPVPRRPGSRSPALLTLLAGLRSSRAEWAGRYRVYH